jgi:hypothetical protein
MSDHYNTDLGQIDDEDETEEHDAARTHNGHIAT